MPKDRSTEGPEACNRLMQLTSDDKPATVVIAGVGQGRELPGMRELWPDARFIGFEPLEEFFTIDLMKFFGPGDLFNKALVADRFASTCTLHTNYRPDQRASLVPQLIEMPGETSREVECMTLRRAEGLCAWPKPALLWLDVQGAENIILRDCMAETGQPRFDWINVEMNVAPARDGVTASGVFEKADDVGYACVGIHSVSKWLDEFDAVFVPRDDWMKLRRKKSRESIARQQKFTRAGRKLANRH